MTTTDDINVVAVLQAYVDAADLWIQRTQRDFGLGSDLYVDIAHDETGAPVQLRLSTLKGVLNLLAELCPVHVACESCERTLCRECGVGEPADCGHQDAELLCVDCQPVECRECRSLIRAESRVNRHWRAS